MAKIKIVQARLDDETDDLLKELRRRTGLTESQLLRAGLRALAALPPGDGPRVIGVGRFRSGIRDLGSNKAHLEDFGRR